MPKAKAKSVAEAVREQPDGAFFRNRHLYEIFLDDDETVSFHKTRDCATKQSSNPDLIRSVLPCGVCKAVADSASTIYLSKYGDKYHLEGCKHVQEEFQDPWTLPVCRLLDSSPTA